MIIILIRHGRTEANERHLYCGSTDIGLSENGSKELIEKRNAALYPPPDGMRIITSGMKRCEQTLAVLFGELAHEIDRSFCEMDFGAFEMRSYEQLKNVPEYIAWITGDNEANAAPDGESGRQMAQRAAEALGRIAADGRDTVIVTHGGVIASVMARLFPAQGKNRYEWQPSYGEGYIVDLDRHTYSTVPYGYNAL